MCGFKKRYDESDEMDESGEMKFFSIFNLHLNFYQAPMRSVPERQEVFISHSPRKERVTLSLPRNERISLPPLRKEQEFTKSFQINEEKIEKAVKLFSIIEKVFFKK